MIGAKVSEIKELSEELAVVLDASDCRVSRRGAAVDIEVPRDDPLLVQLLSLYHQLNEGDSRITGLPPLTAILGLTEDGAPLLVRLPSPDVAHILVAGTTGSGKTVLMQSMILSLAMANPAPSPFQVNGSVGGLRLLLIDPKRCAFGIFQELPHLARDVIQGTGEATEALQSLVHLMERQGEMSSYDRSLQGIPRTVVFLDELAHLLIVGGQPIRHALTQLTQHGQEAGIHVVAATQEVAVLQSLKEALFPVRLVGRMASAGDARTATGWSGTGAERLVGRGDFLTVAEGRVTRFQAAYVSPEEIRKVLAHLACTKVQACLEMEVAR